VRSTEKRSGAWVPGVRGHPRQGERCLLDELVVQSSSAVNHTGSLGLLLLTPGQ
jgi:hypothetical protein